MSKLLMVALAGTMLSLPAVAEEGSFDAVQVTFAGYETDVSYGASRARLTGQGYHQIRQTNGSPLHLSAFDPQGSEVLLTVDPQTGEIDSAYVHAMDE